MDLLRKHYSRYSRLFVTWDAAPWHDSARLWETLAAWNTGARGGCGPSIEVLPLPSSSQFLNVIESVFSGVARAVLHNSDYASLEKAQQAVARYLDDRNATYAANPRPAKPNRSWGKERVAPVFSESNNCKDPRWHTLTQRRETGDGEGPTGG